MATKQSSRQSVVVSIHLDRQVYEALVAFAMANGIVRANSGGEPNVSAAADTLIRIALTDRERLNYVETYMPLARREMYDKVRNLTSRLVPFLNQELRLFAEE